MSKFALLFTLGLIIEGAFPLLVPINSPQKKPAECKISMPTSRGCDKSSNYCSKTNALYKVVVPSILSATILTNSFTLPPALASETSISTLSPTVVSAVSHLQSSLASKSISGVQEDFESIGRMIAYGVGLGGAVSFDNLDLRERGVSISGEDTTVYNPGLITMTDQEKVSDVGGGG